MGRLLNLAVILSVLWCGLHLPEPAGIAAGLVDVAHAESLPGHCDDEAGGKIAHSGHHHCPVAPEQRYPAVAATPRLTIVLLFARQSGALPSLAQAPPLQPPTA